MALSLSEMPPNNPAMTKPQKSLVAAAILSAALLFIPIANLFLLPVTYLNTHIHELFHALAALGTRGNVSDIKVFSDGSGVTQISGGLTLIVGSAGYVGASLAGGWMIVLSRNAKSASRMMVGLAAILALSMLIFVRGDLVGLVAGASWIVALAYFGNRLTPEAAVFSGQFLGIQQCINAFQSLQTLIIISSSPKTMSDAMILQRSTGIPAIIWACVWTLFSVVILVLCLKKAWTTR